MTPTPIQRLLESRGLLLLARLLLTLMFWSSGLAKLIDFSGGMAEMSHFGLEPAALFNILTIIVQLGGSLLIIFNRWTWLGTGALAVFTLLTIPLAHAFWRLEGEAAMMEMHVVVEHLSIVGALILAAIFSQRTRHAHL